MLDDVALQKELYYRMFQGFEQGYVESPLDTLVHLYAWEGK